MPQSTVIFIRGIPAVEILIVNTGIQFHESEILFQTYVSARDDIVGIVYLKDLLNFRDNQENFNLKNVMREPLFIPGTKKMSSVQEMLFENHQSMAIVVDEYSGTDGIVTEKDIKEILDRLESLYPDAKCALDHRNIFELIVAVSLSAQTTDKSVNIVTPELFRAYPDAFSLAKADLSDVEEKLRRIGMYRNKSKNIINLAKELVERFNGEVPRDYDALVSLPGVGRKTANLVLARGFNKPAICVDVHVHRIFNRLGYVKTKTPEETEFALREKLPKKYWIDINTLMVTHGQNCCKPQKPDCIHCPIEQYCAKNI